MSITVAELLRLPHLRMSLVSGAAGVDREVSWVHTSDLPNPWEWHGSGELLLTNGTGLGADEAAQVTFIERLAEAGPSGIAIGLGTGGPPLTGAASRRADELALPLLTVPFSVSFTAVVRAVADANDREESRQLWRVSRLYELLRASVAAGRPAAQTLAILGDELGARLYLVDPATGQPVIDGHAESAYAPVLAASYAAHGGAIPGMLWLRLPGAPPGQAGAVAVAIPGEQPTALVVEPAGDQLPSPVLLQHAAVGGALELAQLTAEQERQRRLGADLLAQLLDRRLDAPLAEARLAEAGVDLRASVLAVARARDDAGAALVHRKLGRSRIGHLALRRGPLLYLLLPAAGLPGNGPGGEPRLGMALGASDPLGSADRIPDAAEEARWALSMAEAQGRAVVRYGDDAPVLPPRTPAEARALVTAILQPLINHDAGHSSEYIRTLRAMLAADRSWSRAAAELHIHKQTLGYRIRKIEQLTGRGLTSTEHLAQWWLALRAHDLLTGQLAAPAAVAAGDQRPAAAAGSTAPGPGLIPS